jgi:polyhydroxybutyrate depolymerase
LRAGTATSRALSTLCVIHALFISCTHETLSSGGRLRQYLVYVPEVFAEADAPRPLLLVFHGSGGSAAGIRAATGFDREARRLGFVVAYPEGTGLMRDWASHRASAAFQAGVDDVRFVSDLIVELSRTLPIDSNRIYATGFSSGGHMVQRLACERSALFAAVASVGAALDSDVAASCAPEHQVSVLFILGAEDASLTWDRSRRVEGYPSLTVPEALQHWAALNGCRDTPDTSNLPTAQVPGIASQRWDYPRCTNDVMVVAYLLRGVGHEWPSRPNSPADTTHAFDASRTIADFFASLR